MKILKKYNYIEKEVKKEGKFFPLDYLVKAKLKTSMPLCPRSTDDKAILKERRKKR